MMVLHHHTVVLVSWASKWWQHWRLTFDLRFLQGIQADETARRFEALVSAGESTSSTEVPSSLGRMGRGGIAMV
jgi:hypothetical protein